MATTGWFQSQRCYFCFRLQTIEGAKADSERIKLVGTAEASAIAGVGKADAERMKQKAAVYKQYGEAAIMSIVLEALPKVRYKNTVSHKPNIY